MKSAKTTIKNLQKGFTLIELLVVIGILAILLAIVLIAINPAKQFGQANDTKRASDVNAILNAIDQYMADNKGVPPSVITSTSQDISNSGADLCGALTPKYLAALPSDPTAGSPTNTIPEPCPATYNTKYKVSVDSSGDNRISVTAPSTYAGTPIVVTR